MNEPTEFAQGVTGKLTAKQLRIAIREARRMRGDFRMFAHGVAVEGRASYSDAFVFELSLAVEDRKAASKSCTVVKVPGWVSNGSTSERKEHMSETDGHRWTTYAEAYRPTRGFWSLFSTEGALYDLLCLLPGDAEVAFHVYLDAGSNEYLIRAECPMGRFSESGLHSDHFYLVSTSTVRGKRREQRFLIDVSTGAHNSARFGSPAHGKDSTGRSGRQ